MINGSEVVKSKTCFKKHIKLSDCLKRSQNQIFVLKGNVRSIVTLQKIDSRLSHLHLETLGITVADDLATQNGRNP